MATEIKLPRLGQGMESGTIVKWLKSEGDSVKKGEPLYELDTDKVTQEVEADAAGVLLKIAVSEGEVPVGETIAFVGEEGEEVSITPVKAPEPAAAAPEPSAEAPSENGGGASASEGQAPPPAPARTDGRIKASPLARRIARERGIDLAQVRGTGPEGRIVAEDVERAEAQPAAAPAAAAAVPVGEIEIVPVSNIRRTIARRLTEAWTVPVFQLTVDADMGRALALRETLVKLAGDRPKPTVTDVLTKVCAVALMRNRPVNAHFGEDGIKRFPSANVGIAVAAPQGLVVPVIQRADQLSIQEIAASRSDLVGRSRENKLRTEDMENGTFTISNLGMFAVEQFVAVLNPPQAAILAVGATVEKPVVQDGAIVARPMLTLTLTCDHRSIDGADGARFLGDVKSFLEEPGLAL